MRTTQRALALGLFAAFGTAAGGGFYQLATSAPTDAEKPTLLPAAYANPAEVGFQDTLRAGETISQLLARAELAEG